jgi:sulfoxide reductase catalytic subunit YedY
LLSGTALLAACAPQATPAPSEPAPQADGRVDEMGDPVNSFDDITHYNNFYEFTEDKQGVAVLAPQFHPTPWTVEVTGLVRHPQSFGLEDILKKFPQEERIYRLRCVEAWSMVIPWMGFPLSRLLDEVQPTSDARFVRFETVMRPEEMPGQKSFLYPWPYEEGLRLDEAMHDLTILATGLYGEALPVADGAPIRLVVPWKYGFKSIKSIVKIELVNEQPATFWNNISAREYGFYSNVNPDRPHPRWSQASERRIGELNRRPTLPFNGYADQVASLYTGMDLIQNY